jgi:hypothetical protein
VGSQRRGVLGEHPAILQASAVADLWRSRLTAQAHPRLNHCSTTPPGSQVMQFFRINQAARL